MNTKLEVMIKRLRKELINDISKLETYYKTYKGFRKVSGIYFLYYWGKLQYIGQAVDIERRIAKHRNSTEFVFTHYAVQIQWYTPIRLIYECIYIQQHRPPHNKTCNPDFEGKKIKQKNIDKPIEWDETDEIDRIMDEAMRDNEI